MTLHLLPEVASKADAIARHPSAHVPAAVHRHRVDEPTARRFIGEAQRRTSNGTTVAPATHKQNGRSAGDRIPGTAPAPTTAAS